MRVHLDPTLQRAPGSWKLWFLGPPGTPTQTSIKRACSSQAGVRWVANACPGPAGALEDPRTLAQRRGLRTSLGRRLGDGGSGVRGRGRKKSPHGGGGPKKGRLGFSGAQEAKALRGRRSASFPDPFPSQTWGPLDRHGFPGRRKDRGKGGCESPRGLGPAVFRSSVRGTVVALLGLAGSLFARPAGSDLALTAQL